MKERTEKSKLYWVTNHHTYYHDYLFQHIEDNQKFDLVVCYRQLVLDSHPWKEIEKVGYVATELSRHPFGLDLRLIWKAIWTKNDFIIAGWDNTMYIILITVLRLRNKPFGVFSDTPRRPGKGWMQYLKVKWLRYVFNSKSKAVLLVTGSIGVSRSVEYFHLNPQHVRNFPFATNHSIFSPSEVNHLTKERGPVTFLAVGRIDFDHKGQDVAVKAFASLLIKGITNFKYKIAGLGNDLQRMKELVHELGLDHYVEYLGWLEIRDLPRIFNEAHFTLHSSHEDPFPNAVLESLSCGVPVISSDAAGSSVDRIIPGINGFLFPDGNIEILEKYLEAAIVMEEDQWKNMKVECRNRALDWPASYNINILSELFSKN